MNAKLELNRKYRIMKCRLGDYYGTPFILAYIQRLLFC